MKKLLIVIIIVIIVLLVLGIVVYFRSTPAAPADGTPDGTSVEPSGTLPEAPQPTGDHITLQGPRGTVTVNNFYGNALIVGDQTVLIQDTDTFAISFVRVPALFIITVRGETRDEALQNRVQAEAALLGVLGVTREDACRLNAEENISGPAELELAQTKGLPLSFCTVSATQ